LGFGTQGMNIGGGCALRLVQEGLKIMAPDLREAAAQPVANQVFFHEFSALSYLPKNST